MSKREMILTDLSELEWGYFQEIIAIAGEQEDGIASEIGVSLRYLNTKLKGAKEIFPGRSRTALLRTRQKLERRELIETYHMDKWQMVSKGKATHVRVTGRGWTMLMIWEKQQSKVLSQSDEGKSVTSTDDVTSIAVEAVGVVPVGGRGAQAVKGGADNWASVRSTSANGQDEARHSRAASARKQDGRPSAGARAEGVIRWSL